MITFTDKIGRKVEVGDVVAYALSSGQTPKLVLGEVIQVTETKDRYSRTTPSLKVRPYAGGRITNWSIPERTVVIGRHPILILPKIQIKKVY